MNRGVDKRAVFFADADRVEFGRLLGVGHDRFGVVVHAYCLMTNHFHLVVECPDGGLSGFMHDVTSAYVRHTNDRVGRCGPLFGSRFHSVGIGDDAQLARTVRYVHRNPLDLPGGTIGQYRWSSHRTYVGCRRRPHWLRTDVVLGLFADDRAAFDRFVDTDSSGATSADVDHLVAAVDLVVEQLHDELAGGRQRVERVVLTLLLDRLAGRDRTRLADVLEFPNERAEYQALRRARRRAAGDAALVRLVDRAVALAAGAVPTRQSQMESQMVPGTI